MAQKFQCLSRRVDVLTGLEDKNRKIYAKTLEEDLKHCIQKLTALKYRLKEKESTAYLESSRPEIEMLREQINDIQRQIADISCKKREREHDLSDDVNEELK